MPTLPSNHLLLSSNTPHSYQNLCTPLLSLLPNGAHKPLAQNHAGSLTTQYHRAPIFHTHYPLYIQTLYHHQSPLKSQRIAKTQRINLPPAWLVGPYQICAQIHIYFIHSDQAVKTLSEVWRIQDIPAAFSPPPSQSTTAAIKSLSQKRPLAFGNEQLSSPISESTSSTPQTTTTISSTATTSTTATSLPPGNDSDLLPIRSFVHEVLRRSRTSGIVLQTALCYLEAVRPEVPNLLREEKMGIRAYYEPESRILPATEAEIAQEAMLNVLETSEEIEGNDDGMNTVRIADDVHDFDSEPKNSHETFSPSTSASLPSPLLCPRRTFLASVILASKFSQDKCYSNRAWAKLSGLPPREIGRCERALGQALGWRLWVGKTLLSSHTPCSSPPLKQIVRSQSESSIMIHSIPSQFLNQENSTIDKPVSSSQGRGLRSCATLPVDAFVSQRIASSVESSKHVDNQGVIDRITYNRESLSDCPLGHQDCSSSLTDSVCTRYEQSGRTQEWISNSQVFIPLALKGPSSFFLFSLHLRSCLIKPVDYNFRLFLSQQVRVPRLPV